MNHYRTPIKAEHLSTPIEHLSAPI